MRKFHSITIRTDRQFKAFTGLSEEEFGKLLEVFTQCLESEKRQRYKRQKGQRRRRPGGGRKGQLSTPELKLFFLLYYLKNYPTFDRLGDLFDLSPGKANENVSRLIPVLRKAQQILQILPQPHLHFPDQNRQEPEKKEQQPTEEKRKIIIDATERPSQRPGHARKQKHYYSGKKRRHTLKNTIMTDGARGIRVVGPTAPGSQHDFSLLKKELDPEQPALSSVEAVVDLGYQGMVDHYPGFERIQIPHKKPRKTKTNPTPCLTPRQKKENRSIGRARIAVEHLIGDLKAFHILSDRFRNRIDRMANHAIVLVAGLCNLKNGYVIQ
jgi:hypothetical protein